MSQKKRQTIERDELHRVRWDNINWPIFLGLAGLHVGCLLAPSISRGVHLVWPYFSGGLLVESVFAWDSTGF